MSNSDHTHKYLSYLKIDKVCTRLLLFNDLEWYKEMCTCSPFEKSTHVFF